MAVGVLADGPVEDPVVAVCLVRAPCYLDAARRLDRGRYAPRQYAGRRGRRRGHQRVRVLGRAGASDVVGRVSYAVFVFINPFIVAVPVAFTSLRVVPCIGARIVVGVVLGLHVSVVELVVVDDVAVGACTQVHAVPGRGLDFSNGVVVDYVAVGAVDVDSVGTGEADGVAVHLVTRRA